VTITEYQNFVDENCREYTDKAYSVIALNGEAGEVAEWYKKAVLRGNPDGKLSKQDLKEELGDVLFYLVRLAALYKWSLEEVMDANVAKLEKRKAKNGIIG